MEHPRYWTAPVEIEVPLERTALIVVDMQRWCAHPESTMAAITRQRLGAGAGDYYFQRVASLVVPNIRRLLTFFRDHNLPILYLTIGKETPDGRDLNRLWRQRDQEWARRGGVPEYFPQVGTSEHAILPDVAPHPGEPLINKTTAGAFNSSSFQAVLEERGIEALYFAGVVTNGCVGTTLRDASDRGYPSVLVEDACAAFSAEMHQAALLVLGAPMAKILRTEDVLVRLGRRVQINIVRSTD